MIFLDWLLRFHPIIIILLQGPATWTPEAWLRRKLWLCLSVSVALSLLAPGPMVTWSHATGSLLFVGHSNVSCAPDSEHGGKMPGYSGNMRQYREWYYKLHIDTHADHRPGTEPCSDHVQRMLDVWCLMEEGWSLPLPLHGQFGCQSPAHQSPHLPDAWLWADWQCSL